MYMEKCINRNKYSHAPKTGRPVCQTGRKSVRFSACPAIGRPVAFNLSCYRTDSKSGQYCPDFERFGLNSTGRPITGQYCPDFRRSST